MVPVPILASSNCFPRHESRNPIIISNGLAHLRTPWPDDRSEASWHRL